MASRNKTPEAAPTDFPESSPIKPYHAPIDEAKRDEWSENVYNGVKSEISLDNMFDVLVPSDRQDWVKQMNIKFQAEMPEKKKEFIAYLNELSQHVRDHITSNKTQEPKPALDYTIVFQDTGNTIPGGHPTGTQCRPDIVALRRSDKDTRATDPIKKFCWGHLEATGEVDSGKGEPKGCAQAAAYTAFHLQARPDLTTALGIYIKDKGCRLFASNACVVYVTPISVKEDVQQRRLALCGWMWRIYVADRDESLAREYQISSTPPTFTLKHDGKDVVSGMSIIYAGETIGRRTIVLRGKHSITGQDVVPKYQYIEKERRFKEDNLLTKIHAEGRFPGIVDLIPDSTTTPDISVTGRFEDDKTITRKKVRLLLNKSGIELLGIETPREVLMAIYDALEVSRILFEKYEIFHRDYSKNNILLLEKGEDYAEAPGLELKDMCFSQFLLAQGDGQADPSSRARLTTRLLLIDFDSGEDISQKARSDGKPLPRTGTPIFMARRVRGRLALGGPYDLPPMPDLDEQVAGYYAAMHPERVETFLPKNEREIIDILDLKILEYDKHHLRYEAESLFWCLLYWCMTAQPAVALEMDNQTYSKNFGEGFRTKVPSNDWGNLVGEPDKRNETFISLASLPKSTLHPSYASLYPLLDDMRKHLKADVEEFKDPLKKEPDYIHEVFQRLILNFLARNRDELFMNRKRSKQERGRTKGGFMGNSTSARTTTKGKSSDRPSSGQSTGSKRPADEVLNDADEQSNQPPTKKQKGLTSDEL